MNKSNATLIGFSAIALWGALALLTRLTDNQVPPFQLMSMTFAIAFLLMLTKWRKEGHWGVRYAKQKKRVWLLGVSGYFGYHFCYFLAMSKAPAVQVSLLAYLWPLLIVLFSTLLPGHRFRWAHLVGALSALVGCWLLIGGGSDAFEPQYTSGYLIALACALIWSSFSVTSRLAANVPTDAAGWFCGATAVLAFICHLAWETTVMPANLIQWIGVIGLGLGPVGIAFFTWDYGVKHGNIQLLGVLAYSAPLISVVLLVLFGLAEPSWTLAWACLAIVGGSLIAGFERNKKAAQ
ncbi:MULTISPECIES: DMT family transporter [unclassified Marinobacterium]|uniref:aromatic amino acid exporter YddG n=1 Tax=unclassified Marinobacterium TaxID=2644139 RepID=UPI00156A0400|nr:MULTISPECIES: EamA family transporter [unclassified Marinobacterium]NRP59334.1 Aromatic amino acid exporter YddG [Marinobacterium sp. xm-d-564]NRP94943.1 Aromatic amino acid exporter YddG [Marinobacterium sp. xm-g-59]